MTCGARSTSKLLDYEQYIDHQLGRTRARIKMTDILTAALILVAAAVGVLLLEVVLDHLVGLPLWVRQLVLASGLAAGGAFATLRIVLPLLRRVNDFYAARTIEEADPAFKNSLINYLDLKRRRDEVPRAALAAIEARAVDHLTMVEVDTVVNQRRLIHVAYALSGIVVLFCGYAALTPKSILDSARRALLADVMRPTNTRLLHIKPGDDPSLNRVMAGTDVPFTVLVQGVMPDRLLLHFSGDGGRSFSTLAYGPGGSFWDAWSVVLPNVHQSLDYYLTGGDAESPRYRLEVLPIPRVTSVSLDCEFPSYTGIPPLRGIEGGNIEAVEGTVVMVHAKTNEPARSGFLALGTGDALPLEVSHADLRELVGTIRISQSGTYAIRFRAPGGLMNPDPVIHDIVAIPDRPPTARFTRPDGPALRIPSNAGVVLEMEAFDDYGIRNATLHIQPCAQASPVSEDLLDREPPTCAFRATRSLDLAALKAGPGSRLEYWLTVRDTKEPRSNTFETPHQVLNVVEPWPPSEQRGTAEAEAQAGEEGWQPPQESSVPAARGDSGPPEIGSPEAQRPSTVVEGRQDDVDTSRAMEEKARDQSPGQDGKRRPNRVNSEDGKARDMPGRPEMFPPPADRPRPQPSADAPPQPKGPHGETARPDREEHADQRKGDLPQVGKNQDREGEDPGRKPGDRPKEGTDQKPEGSRKHDQPVGMKPSPGHPSPKLEEGHKGGPDQKPEGGLKRESSDGREKNRALPAQSSSQRSNPGQPGSGKNPAKDQPPIPGQLPVQGGASTSMMGGGSSPGNQPMPMNDEGLPDRPVGLDSRPLPPQVDLDPRSPSRPRPSEAGETAAPDVSPPRPTPTRPTHTSDDTAGTLQPPGEAGMPDGAAAPFVKKFEQAPRDGPGPSRVIEIRATAKDRDLESDGVHLATDLSPGPATGSMRSRNDIAHDQERDLAQGNRFLAPPELRSQFEAYKSRVSRWDGPRARPAPSGAKAVGR